MASGVGGAVLVLLVLLAWGQGSAERRERASAPGPARRDALPPEQARLESTPLAQPRPVGRLAIVLDDAGHRLEDLDPFLNLPFPVAISVLPHLPHSQASLRRVLEAGKTPLLHLPMQPTGEQDPGPGALLVADPPERIRAKVGAALDSLPGVVGVNNHMGSLFTARAEPLRQALLSLAERGLFFLDSLTTSSSVAAQVAQELGLPYLRRDVFLDHDVRPEAVREALAQARRLASPGRDVIVIGHVTTPLLGALLWEFFETTRHELDIVDLRELLR